MGYVSRAGGASARRTMLTYLISSYQKERYIGAVLDSVRQDGEGLEHEIFIIDDGSRDESWRVIERFAAKNDRVVATRQANRGIFAVMNQLLPLGRHPFIRIVDSDDPIVPGSSAAMIRAAKELDAAYVFGDKIEYGPEPSSEPNIATAGIAASESSLVDDPLGHAIVGYNHIPSCTLIARRALSDVAPLPPGFVSCQDLALALQIFRRHRVAHLDGVVCRQLVGVSNRLSANETRTFQQTVRLIQHYGGILDEGHRRLAANKLISRTMRWARRNQPLPWAEWARLWQLRARLRLLGAYDFDSCLDAAARPLERSLAALEGRQPY
jgi:hypothetical protein